MKTTRSVLHPVRAKWRNIGIELEIDIGTLDSIEKSFHFDHTECLSRMLENWLKQTDPPPSWDAIVEALESGPVGEGHLAEQIKQKYCTSSESKSECVPPPHTVTVVSESSSVAACTTETQYVRYLKALYTSSNLPSDNKWPPTPSKHYINLAFIDKQRVSRHEADEFTKYTIKGNIDDICRKKAPITIEKVACMQEIPFAYDPSQMEVSYPKLVIVTGAPGVGKSTFAWELCRKWGNGELLRHFELVILLRLRDETVRRAKDLTDILIHRKKSISESLAIEIEQNNGKGVLFLLEGFDELPWSMRVDSSLYLDLIYGRLLPLATVLVTSRPWAISELHWKARERISQQFEILGFTKQQIDKYLISITLDDSNLLDELRHYVSLNPPIHAAMYIPLNAAIVFDVYKDRRGRTDCVIPNTMTELYTAFSHTLLIRYLVDQGTRIRKVSSFADLPREIYKKFLNICKLANDGINNGDQLIFSDLPDDFETLGFMQSVPELHFSVGVSVSYNFLHLTIQEFLAAYHLSLQLAQDGDSELYYYTVGNQKESVMRFLAGITKLNNPSLLKELSKSQPSGIEMILLHRYEELEQIYESIILKTVRSCNDISSASGVSTVITHHKATVMPHVVGSHINLSCNEYTDRTLGSRYEWFYESQNIVLLQECIGTKTTFLMISKNMSPMDCFVAGWCIGNSNCKWQLCFNEEDGIITMECMEMLHAGIKQCIHPSANNEICELYVCCGNRYDSETTAAALTAFFDLQDIVTFNIKKFVVVSSSDNVLPNCYISPIGTIIREFIHLEEVILDFKHSHSQDTNNFILDAVFASKSADKLQSLKLGGSLSESFLKRCSSLLILNPNIIALSLYFSSTFEIESDATSVKMLTANFISCKSLKELIVCNYPFYVHGMLLHQVTGTLDALNKLPCNSGELITFLLKETSLETLNLRNCGLSEDDTTIIAEAVSKNKTLLALDLGDNHCASAPLADMLRANQTLRVLRLYGASIDVDGLFDVFACNENGTLRTLDVRDNDYSATNLEGMLRTNSSLQCLELTVAPKYFTQSCGDVKYADKNQIINSVCLAIVRGINNSQHLLQVVIHTADFFNDILIQTLGQCQGYDEVKEQIQIKQHFNYDPYKI